MKILGISAFYHDSAATVVINGNIVAAAQEERFTRKKHDYSFPTNAIKFVLSFSNLSVNDLDAIIFYENPLLKFDRLLKTYLHYSPKGFSSYFEAMKIWLNGKIFQKKIIFKKLNDLDKKFQDKKKIFFSEHHLSHAASAFYPSPFKEAIILTFDGVGEWATTTVAIGNKNKIDIVKEIYFPHSLGLLYSAFTYYCGFKVNSGEYKLMGLAPYGVPKYKDIIKNNLIDIKPDGSFRLNQAYFDYAAGFKMTSRNFHILFGSEPRKINEPIKDFHMNLASSIQFVIEEIIFKICKSLKGEFNIKNLCLAGGVALNCVANGKILKEKLFENIWVQPASGDAGGSLGCALNYWYNIKENLRVVSDSDSMNGSYLGPEFNDVEIENQLNKIGAKYQKMNEDRLTEVVATEIENGKAIGWFQGRMEFGPRALGSRSILADSRSTEMQKNLNLKIKYRESFRPFAPIVLREDLKEWFELDQDVPYMTFVANVNKNKLINLEHDKAYSGLDKLKISNSTIPAVTHVDNSARVQSVDEYRNKKLYKLLKKFKEKTGCPVMVNTSFNVRGEPIVNTPQEAFSCFMGTEMDILVIGNCFLIKKEQNPNLKQDYKDKFDLD